jgi:hypothetical protein
MMPTALVSEFFSIGAALSTGCTWGHFHDTEN